MDGGASGGDSVAVVYRIKAGKGIRKTFAYGISRGEGSRLVYGHRLKKV